MASITPITRKEYYLAKLAGEDVDIPVPVTREETYLAKLCGMDVEIPTPVTVDELYLAAMCGMSVVLPTPWTRLQQIWEQLALEGESTITPYTREETLWAGLSLWDFETVTGNPVSFSTLRPAPLRQLEVAFSPVQSGSGDPSPDNVRPISGWSEVTVEQRGKNLFDKNSAEITDGWWSANECTVGEPLPNYAASGNYHTSAPIPVVAGQTYSVVGCGGLNGSFLYLDKDLNFVSGFANQSLTTRTFVVPDNPQIAFLRFPFTTVTVDTCQLEIGSTASPYTPYNPSSRSISISLGQTVYSGYVDVVTGVGEVTMEKITITSADPIYQFAKNADGNWRVRYHGKNDRFKALSNGFYSVGTVSTATSSYNFAPPNVFFVTAPDVYVNPPVGIETEEDYKDWLDSMNGVEAVLYLATPIPIQLTPQEVQSLLGENVMWSDANGDLTVTYRSN